MKTHTVEYNYNVQSYTMYYHRCRSNVSSLYYAIVATTTLSTDLVKNMTSSALNSDSITWHLTMKQKKLHNCRIRNIFIRTSDNYNVDRNDNRPSRKHGAKWKTFRSDQLTIRSKIKETLRLATKNWIRPRNSFAY